MHPYYHLSRVLNKRHIEALSYCNSIIHSIIQFAAQVLNATLIFLDLGINTCPSFARIINKLFLLKILEKYPVLQTKQKDNQILLFFFLCIDPSSNFVTCSFKLT